MLVLFIFFLKLDFSQEFFDEFKITNMKMITLKSTVEHDYGYMLVSSDLNKEEKYVICSNMADYFEAYEICDYFDQYEDIGFYNLERRIQNENHSCLPNFNNKKENTVRKYPVVNFKCYKSNPGCMFKFFSFLSCIYLSLFIFFHIFSILKLFLL